MVKFSSTIYKIGINPIVDPPEDVLTVIFAQASASNGPIPIRGKINGADYVQTLVKYQGIWRLYINAEMLNSSGLTVGAMAEIEIAYDRRPRVVPMPIELEAALEQNKLAKVVFEGLTPSRRKDILRYIGSLKTERALERNIARVIAQLVTNK